MHGLVPHAGLPSRAVSLRRAAFLAATLATLMTGCVKKPTMSLDHAELTGVGIRLGAPPSIGVLMTVVLNVHNPNGYDVAVRAVRGQVVFGGRYGHPVDFRAPGDGVWLRAGTVTRVSVPIQLPLELAFALVRDAAFSPTIPYRFTGKADVTATSSLRLERDDYAVDEAGVLTRQQMEAVLIPIPH
jgi:hypothetical protein